MPLFNMTAAPRRHSGEVTSSLPSATLSVKPNSSSSITRVNDADATFFWYSRGDVFAPHEARDNESKSKMIVFFISIFQTPVLYIIRRGVFLYHLKCGEIFDILINEKNRGGGTI